MQWSTNIVLRLPVRQAAFLALAGAVVFQLYLLNSKQPAPSTAIVDIPSQYYQYTQKFPQQIDLDHTLVDLKTGDPVHLATQVAGKTVILTFMSLTCYQCMQDLPNWIPYRHSLATNDDVAFIFVLNGPSRPYATYMLNRHPDFTLPVLFDATNILVEANNIPEVPATLLLDRHSRVVLAGSPVFRPEVRRMYQTHIEQLSRQRSAEGPSDEKGQK